VLASAAITVAVSRACLGQKPSVLHSYRRLFDVIGKFLWTYVLLLIVIIVGFALLVVPGIVAITMLLFTTVVVILERRSGIDAFKRSIALGKGYYLRNLGVIALMAVLVIVGQLVLALLAATAIYALDDIEQPGILARLLISAISHVLGPIPLIATVLLYYDIRVRKENYDTAALTQDLVG
ncbi:MAG: YciC family protein, partial [Dongiaceae bacterium]